MCNTIQKEENMSNSIINDYADKFDELLSTNY